VLLTDLQLHLTSTTELAPEEEFKRTLYLYVAIPKLFQAKNPDSPTPEHALFWDAGSPNHLTSDSNRKHPLFFWSRHSDPRKHSLSKEKCKKYGLPTEDEMVCSMYTRHWKEYEFAAVRRYLGLRGAGLGAKNKGKGKEGEAGESERRLRRYVQRRGLPMLELVSGESFLTFYLI